MLPNPFASGKLEKMYIQAYKTTDKAEKPELSNAEDDKFQVQVNPESITVGHRVMYNYNYVEGNSGVEKTYAGTEASELSVDLLFDATGVIPATSGPLDNVPIVGAISSLFEDDEGFDVMRQLGKFLKVVYNYEGTNHGPRKVRIVYGKIAMDAVLTSVDIEYKLFKSDGTPIRALARARFAETISDLLRENKEKNSSSDLTHQRTVIAGDKLPLLVHSIYRNTNHYLAVARANKLYNFRNLNAGEIIAFPPIEKSTK